MPPTRRLHPLPTSQLQTLTLASSEWLSLRNALKFAFQATRRHLFGRLLFSLRVDAGLENGHPHPAGAVRYGLWIPSAKKVHCPPSHQDQPYLFDTYKEAVLGLQAFGFVLSFDQTEPLAAYPFFHNASE